MNAADQVEVIEEKVADADQNDIALSLADLDLVGGGSIGQVFL